MPDGLSLSKVDLTKPVILSIISYVITVWMYVLQGTIQSWQIKPPTTNWTTDQSLNLTDGQTLFIDKINLTILYVVTAAV
jgi:hypothetical protein